MREQRTRSRGQHVLVYTDTYARTSSRKHPVLVSSVASHPSRMGTSIRACELKHCAACAAATCRDLGATAIALGFFKTMRRLRRGRLPRPTYVRTYVPTLQPQPAEQVRTYVRTYFNASVSGPHGRVQPRPQCPYLVDTTPGMPTSSRHLAMATFQIADDPFFLRRRGLPRCSSCSS